MSGGYTKEEVIRNIRRIRSKKELEDLAFHSKGQIHEYAEIEARRELKRRELFVKGKGHFNKKKKENIFGIQPIFGHQKKAVSPFRFKF